MSRALLYALAGLQAGTAGALALLLWMSLAARFFGKSLWWSSNLIASAFYGDGSLKFGPGKYTIVGAALILFVYGTVGILFGLLWRDRNPGAGALATSLIIATMAYYLLFKRYGNTQPPKAPSTPPTAKSSWATPSSDCF